MALRAERDALSISRPVVELRGKKGQHKQPPPPLSAQYSSGNRNVVTLRSASVMMEASSGTRSRVKSSSTVRWAATASRRAVPVSRHTQIKSKLIQELPELPTSTACRSRTCRTAGVASNDEHDKPIALGLIHSARKTNGHRRRGSSLIFPDPLRAVPELVVQNAGALMGEASNDEHDKPIDRGLIHSAKTTNAQVWAWSSLIFPHPLRAVPELVIQMAVTSLNEHDKPVNLGLIHSARISDGHVRGGGSLIFPYPLRAVPELVVQLAVASFDEHDKPINLGLIHGAKSRRAATADPRTENG
jgi:hypothetical protein